MVDRNFGFGDTLAGTAPGTTVRISESSSGPGVTTRTIEINAPSGLGNYNPHARALVEATDINGVRTTQEVPIGGSHSPSQITYQTGTLNSSETWGITEVTVIPYSAFPTNLNVKSPIPGTIGNILAGLGRVNVGIDSITGISHFTVAPISTEVTPISFSSNYPPGFLESLGIDPSSLPDGLVGQFDSDGNLIGLERTECFGPETPIDGTVALFYVVKSLLTRSRISTILEQSADELDLALDAWLFAMDMAALDGSDCFYPAKGRFC